MKKGDVVRINIDGIWKAGVYLGQKKNGHKVGIGEPHHFNYEEKVVTPFAVKQFVPLAEEEFEKQSKQELKMAFELTEMLLAKFIPDVTAKIEDKGIFAYGVTLDPEYYDQHTIGQIIERVGWQVRVWKETYGDYNTPPDRQDTFIGSTTCWRSAVWLFVKTIFERKLNDFADFLSAQALAEECEDFGFDRDY